MAVFGLLAGCSACTSSGPPASEALPSRGESGGEGQAPPKVPSLAAPEGELVAAELSTVGWDALSGTPVVLLRTLDSGRVLPIWIGLAEARAIVQALHGVESKRPQTHDLMASLLGHLGATLEEVVVTELSGGTYYGLLKLKEADGADRWVDTRPSDGLALALRTGARIRVAAGILEDATDFRFEAPESSDQVVRVLGLTVRSATPELTRELGLPEREGLVVVGVSGEAERRGLERGDLIVAVNGRPPREPLDLLEAIRDASEGILSLTYWRDGREKTIELEIRAEPEETSGGEVKIARFRERSRFRRHRLSDSSSWRRPWLTELLAIG